MFVINIPNGQAIAASYERIIEDNTEPEIKTSKRYWVRIGKLIGEELNKVCWKGEIVVNSAEQARGYEKIFHEIAKKIEKYECEGKA